MAKKLHETKGIATDFGDEGYERRLLAYVFQKLVTYADRKIRHATRLDDGEDSEGVESEGQAIARKLAAPGSTEPLVALLAQEAAARAPPEPRPRQSPAAAWLVLLRRFDNRMQRVANHLLISLSYCYRCYGRARMLAIAQHPLRDASRRKLAPRAWRPFQIIRAPTQFHLDFGPEPELWQAGANDSGDG